MSIKLTRKETYRVVDHIEQPQHQSGLHLPIGLTFYKAFTIYTPNYLTAFLSRSVSGETTVEKFGQKT